MTVSVRAYLIAGAAAATATTIALTPLQVTPADIAVPAHPTSSAPALSQAMVELLAAASRMTAAVPAPPRPAPVPGAGPTAGTAPTLATPNAVAITPQNAASDWVTSAYLGWIVPPLPPLPLPLPPLPFAATVQTVVADVEAAAETLVEQLPATTTTTQTDEVTTDLKSGVQKATDGLRNAVKDATKSKPAKVNTTDKPAKDTSDKSGDE
jgi:hypothetical protein